MGGKHLPARAGETAEGRLQSFLATHPKPHAHYTLADIARAIGVTRQMAFTLLPGYTAKRQRVFATRVRRYLRAHPEALRNRYGASGTSWDEIARDADVPKAVLVRLCRDLGLPTHRASSPDELRERRAERQRRHHARVLGEATCIICKEHFPWTVQRERRRRYQAAPVVCSRTCSHQYFARLRQPK